MAYFIFTRWFQSLLLILLLSTVSGQVVVTFAVEQPPQFLVYAGVDQPFVEGLILGGSPSTALGGTGNYSYDWTPSEPLSAPNSPAPEVLWLPEPTTTFTVSVTDMGTGCTLNDEVSITLTTGIVEDDSPQLTIYPNPTRDVLIIRHPLPITRIVIRSITGHLVLDHVVPPSTSVEMDLGSLSPGLYLADILLVTEQTFTQKICVAGIH